MGTLSDDEKYETRSRGEYSKTQGHTGECETKWEHCLMMRDTRLAAEVNILIDTGTRENARLLTLVSVTYIYSILKLAIIPKKMYANSNN